MKFLTSEEYTYILLPLMIFSLRIIDVSMGTLRIIFVSKGFKKLAPLIGFFEILIWIFAVSRIMENLNNWICYFAYAGGFATGNLVGMILEERLAIGHELIRVITKKEAVELTDALKDKGFGITSIKANGINGEVAVLYIIINRKKINEVLAIIKQYNPQAIYTVEDLKSINREIFHGKTERRKRLSKSYIV